MKQCGPPWHYLFFLRESQNLTVFLTLSPMDLCSQELGWTLPPHWLCLLLFPAWWPWYNQWHLCAESDPTWGRGWSFHTDTSDPWDWSPGPGRLGAEVWPHAAAFRYAGWDKGSAGGAAPVCVDAMVIDAWFAFSRSWPFGRDRYIQNQLWLRQDVNVIKGIGTIKVLEWLLGLTIIPTSLLVSLSGCFIDFLISKYPKWNYKATPPPPQTWCSISILCV